MVVTVRSLGLNGISGYEVSVECFLSGGLPAFDVVGLPDAAVRESRERVRAAIKACGAKFPVSRITVNLAPAGQRKEGTVYDLPILLGILFLDELPEFDKTALETLRQPLEDGVVTITRVSGSLTLPSRFMLVCAMNPCRCGWYGHPSGRCTCSESQVESYMRRISGPLLDRIDMHIEVPSVEYEAMRRREKPETSAQVRQRVNAARDIQKRRFAGTAVSCNAYMTPAMIGQYCLLDAAGERLMKGAFDRLGLTGRSHDRILRMARTIADLDGSERIEAAHLAEAIQYRSSNLLK